MMKVSLKVISGPHAGREFSFEEHDTFIVGRASYAHFRLSKKDQFFSRAHFLIEVNPPFCRLMDMASTNGTIVNDKKVTNVDLKDWDLIKGGHTTIRVVWLARLVLRTRFGRLRQCITPLFNRSGGVTIDALEPCGCWCRCQ